MMLATSPVVMISTVAGVLAAAVVFTAVEEESLV
jgi:nitrate reductase NapAB chaperone NapD